MRSISVGLICFLASTCAGEDPAVDCAANGIDNDDDKCTLLQGGVGLVSLHGEDKVKPQHLEQGSAKVSEKGFPDILKKIHAAFGGADKLEKNFEGIKSAVATFAHDVHQTIKDLLATVNDDMQIEAIATQVEAAWHRIHMSALKVWEAVKKTTETFTATIGKVAPDQFSAAMKENLDKISEKANNFAEEFNHAADRIVKVNKTMVCGTVKHHLDLMHHKVDGLVKSATGLSTKELSEDIKKAEELLPESIKTEVDKILEKANDAAERLKSAANSIMQEISMGVSQAFKGHCDAELQSAAGGLKVGLFSLVLGLLSFLI